MPKRKTIAEKEIEAIIRKNLDELGRLIIATSSRTSKVSLQKEVKKNTVQKDHLRDSGNFKTKPYNVLTVTQNFYGRYNTPKGKPTPADRSNIDDTPMRNAIRNHTDDSIKIIIKNMVDLLKSPVTLKK